MNTFWRYLRSAAFVNVAIFTFLSTDKVSSCFAQENVESLSPAERINFIGYTDRSDWITAIIGPLVDAEQWTLAESMLRRWIDESSSQTVKGIQLHNQLIWLKAKQRLSKSDHSIQYSSIQQDILKDCNAIRSKWESRYHPDSPVPNLDDTKLYLEFGTQKAIAELARFLTAAKLATVNNKSLDSSAQQSIHDNIDALDKLQNRVETRVSELSKSASTTESQLWVNELYRLINEISLQKIDMMVTQMDQLARADEADRIASAANLKTALDELSSKLGGVQADNPQLNLFRARSLAVLGEPDVALKLLDTSFPSISAPTLREQNRLLAIEIMLDHPNEEKKDQARTSLMKLLEEGTSVSPALALAVFKYNLTRVQNKDTVTGEDDVQFLSSEDLRRSMMIDLSSAELIKQKEAIRSKYGTYWMLRAESLLLHRKPNAAGNDPAKFEGIELLDAQVRQDLLAGRYKDAISRLETIEQQAVDGSQLDQAFETARKRNALLHKLLTQQEEIAVSNSTRTARVGIAKRCLDTATKYPSVANAHKEFLQAILIAREAVSRDDVQINRLAVSFIADAIRDNVPLFGASESANSVMAVAEVVLSSQHDYRGLAQLWEQIAVEQSKSGKYDATAQIARRHRAVFQAVCELNQDIETSSEVIAVVSEPQRSPEFSADDFAISELCKSLYWSDLLIQDPKSSSARNDIDTSKSLPWLSSLLKTRIELKKSGNSTHSAPTFDASNSTDNLEKIVYQIVWCKMMCEHYLNSNVELPKQVVDELSAQYSSPTAVANDLPSFVRAGLSNIIIRNRAIWAVLHSKMSKDVDDMKKFANANKSTHNLLWYGRIQTQMVDIRNRESINLLTNVAKLEKVGTVYWSIAKADLIYALKRANELEKAKKEFSSTIERVPDISPAWKQAIEQLLK